MAVKYDFYQTPDPDSKKSPKLHVRAVTQGTINSKELARLIHSRSTLSRGEIEATIISLQETIVEKLKEGSRIHLEGIGYFQMTLTCPPVQSEKEIRAESVQFKSVSFRPEKSLKAELASTEFIRTEYKKHSAEKKGSDIEQLLTDYFAKHFYITRHEFEQTCRLTRSTASRWLQQLVKEGKLIKEGVYRSPIYVPAPGCYGKTSE